MLELLNLDTPLSVRATSVGPGAEPRLRTRKTHVSAILAEHGMSFFVEI